MTEHERDERDLKILAEWDRGTDVDIISVMFDVDEGYVSELIEEGLSDD